MSSFTDTLIVEKINPREWKTWKSFDYYVGELGSNKIVHVPEGFITDFASVPRAFWIFLPPDGIYTQGAVLHDFLYNTKIFPRKECDKIFLEAMKVLKVPKGTRTLMYLAVRWFGWIPWDQKRKNE